jgi:hypothetical protein
MIFSKEINLPRISPDVWRLKTAQKDLKSSRRRRKSLSLLPIKMEKRRNSVVKNWPFSIYVTCKYLGGNIKIKRSMTYVSILVSKQIKRRMSLPIHRLSVLPCAKTRMASSTSREEMIKKLAVNGQTTINATRTRTIRITTSRSKIYAPFRVGNVHLLMHQLPYVITDDSSVCIHLYLCASVLTLNLFFHLLFYFLFKFVL